MEFELKYNDLIWALAYDWLPDSMPSEYLLARYTGDGNAYNWYEISIMFPTPIGNVPALERELGPFISRQIQR